MEFPSELKYTKEHEWIRVEGEVAVVGITDFAQRELGDIVYVDIHSVGSDLAADEVFGTIEAVKTVSDLFLPISGKVLEVNAALDNAPELVNSAPYTQGWIIKLAPVDIAALDNLLDSEAYKKLIGA